MRLISALAALALFAAPLRAFDYDEHKYLSNIALRTAIQMAPCTLPDDLNRYLDRANIEARRSFGDVAALADYIRDADVLFERQGQTGLVIKQYTDLDW